MPAKSVTVKANYTHSSSGSNTGVGSGDGGNSGGSGNNGGAGGNSAFGGNSGDNGGQGSSGNDSANQGNGNAIPQIPVSPSAGTNIAPGNGAASGKKRRRKEASLTWI